MARLPTVQNVDSSDTGDGDTSDADTQPDDTGGHVDPAPPSSPPTGEDEAEKNREEESPA